jgi:hypothetical protein
MILPWERRLTGSGGFILFDLNGRGLNSTDYSELVCSDVKVFVGSGRKRARLLALVLIRAISASIIFYGSIAGLNISRTISEYRCCFRSFSFACYRRGDSFEGASADFLGDALVCIGLIRMSSFAWRTSSYHLV